MLRRKYYYYQCHRNDPRNSDVGSRQSAVEANDQIKGLRNCGRCLIASAIIEMTEKKVNTCNGLFQLTKRRLRSLSGDGCRIHICFAAAIKVISNVIALRRLNVQQLRKKSALRFALFERSPEHSCNCCFVFSLRVFVSKLTAIFLSSISPVLRRRATLGIIWHTSPLLAACIRNCICLAFSCSARIVSTHEAHLSVSNRTIMDSVPSFVESLNFVDNQKHSGMKRICR